ncbi:hypothetical protein BHE74_00015180 [Ensete ventricosum]|nr:hypothetical protein BHE74_00015180 [Ensete ventricosum]
MVDFDCQRPIKPIKGEIDRRRSIEGEKGKKKKRKRRKKKRRRRKPRAVLARASSPPSPVRRHRMRTVAGRAPLPVCHRYPRVACVPSPVRRCRASALASFFSRARRRNVSSCGEKDRAQRKAREMASAELGFKKQLTKEERLEKKKQRLAAIGEAHGRLLIVFCAAQLNLSKLSYAFTMELISCSITQDIKKRWERQSSAFYNLFRQADRVEKLAQMIQRLEQGDLKLRVRTLESERAFQRVAAVQKTIGNVSFQIDSIFLHYILEI